MTRVTNRVYEIPPVPRYWRMTAIGMILCVVAMVLWAASFARRTTCCGYGPRTGVTTLEEDFAAQCAASAVGAASQPVPAPHEHPTDEP